MIDREMRFSALDSVSKVRQGHQVSSLSYLCRLGKNSKTCNFYAKMQCENFGEKTMIDREMQFSE